MIVFEEVIVADSAPFQPGQTLTGPMFSEPMRVETARPGGPNTWIAGLVGVQSERFRSVTLTSADVATIKIVDKTATYKGDPELLRLGLQAYSLGIAHEFDAQAARSRAG